MLSQKIYMTVLVMFSMFVLGCPMTSTDVTTARTFSATLDGNQEAPSVTTDGTGTATFTLSADQSTLDYSINASGLGGAVTGSHFHLAPAGQSGDVIFGIANLAEASDGTVTATGSWNSTAQNVVDLLAGNLYVNLHTAGNPAGEIRGQVIEDQ